MISKNQKKRLKNPRRKEHLGEALFHQMKLIDIKINIFHGYNQC
jgi:hypothetical protein